MRVLVTGATGFIGSNLLSRLKATRKDLDVIAMSRSADKLKKKIGDLDIKIVEADVMDYSSLTKALEGCDVAYYLIHSMEGSSPKQWKKFAERDRKASENFARAATECNVSRIIYLGGLVHENEVKKGIKSNNNNNLSEHMKSRIEVGDILSTSSAKVTIFRAAVILGPGGASYKMLKFLVERLWIMICPKWVLTKCQPIALDDVITYLSKSLDAKETEGQIFDIGGSDTLTYKEMMMQYSKIINKKFLKIIIIPFLTPKLSSYWVELITPVEASLARPLIESLKFESVVKENKIKKLIPISLKSFNEAILMAQRKQNIEEQK
jgi:uncharacterized protein YbjT (DUF2867 family)